MEMQLKKGQKQLAGMHSLSGFHLRTGRESPGEKYSQHKKHLRSKDGEELPVAVTWAWVLLLQL